MACPGRPHRHFVRVPWSEFAQDVCAQGEPETAIHYKHEVHLGLHVRDQEGVTLGMLAIRCAEGPGGLELPLSLAIADTVTEG